MDYLNALCLYLASVGVGTYTPTLSGGSISYPSLPDSAPPNVASCLALRPYGAQPPGPRTFERHAPIWNAPLVQVVSRDADFTAASNRAWLAHDALADMAGVLLSGTYCYGVTCIQTPNLALGREENTNNWLVSFNVAIMKSSI